MALLGKNITLKGITLKGKNRVREQGWNWTVLAETDTVLFSPGQKGPWLFVVPVGKQHDDKAGRWVHAQADKDFGVTVEVDKPL